ncbi:MAG: UDP-glucose 6-dehydrogenase [Desulfuromonas sp.]|nr:MAG: UDP-glucose 6-dehydrogenase [Desulfuromonas sp.]
MKLTIVGTGYVGLVTGTCFAEMGHHVCCVDVDAEKIDLLRQGDVPIHEPGLEALVAENLEAGRLIFETSLPEAMKDVELLFIATGTPSDEDGSADLQHVLAVAREIGQNLSHYAVVIDKSTVPVGTAEMVRGVIASELKDRGVDIEFDVVSNPEFLKEGAAVEDFMRPDRIVVGTDSERASALMRRLYLPFNRNHDRTIFMGIRDAEMTKYAANAMLATKISFINEIACLCDRLDVDVENVRRGIGSDQRIGFHFIYPGCGYGGSCFPKDVKALVHTAKTAEFEPVLLNAVEERNRQQRKVLAGKIFEHFGTDLKGLRFGIWGLSFKPGTDDMREASSLGLIMSLVEAGANVSAYDPVAMDVSRTMFPKEWLESGRLVLAQHQYEAIDGVDAMVLVTEWKPFRSPDYAAMRRLMKQHLIFDGRNQYDPQLVKSEGFAYRGIGRRN